MLGRLKKTRSNAKGGIIMSTDAEIEKWINEELDRWEVDRKARKKRREEKLNKMMEEK